MDKKLCAIYSFLNATGGNWRNSIYVECGNVKCNHYSLCSELLLAFDSEGQPVMFPANMILKMTGLSADKSECLATISLKQFEALFARWLDWRIDTPGECPIYQISIICAGACWL